jgi:hypothetical protein
MAKRDNVTEFVMRGTLQYAKVLGDPVLNYNEDGKEWKFDFVPNNAEGAKAELKRVGVDDRLRSKENYLNGRPYMSFKQAELNRDGEPNKRIKITEIDGQTPWDENKLIGNETVADVRFVVIDNGKGKFKGVYPRSIRVLEHIPYERKEFADLPEDDPYYAAAQEAKAKKEAEYNQFRRDFGLDEDGEDVGNNGADTRDDDDLNDELPV